MKNRSLSLLCLLALLCNIDQTLKAQEQSDDTVRVRTRVVFVDALVQDKRTKEPVRNLARENFEVLDNGRARTLSYFTREGDARTRPLALVLSLNLCTSAILYLERPEVMEGIISALQALPLEDEVAVMQTWLEPTTPAYPSQLAFLLKSKMVEGMTRDREKTYAALRSVQAFARENLPQVKMLFSMKEIFKAGVKAGLGNLDPNDANPPVITTPAPDFEYVVETSPLIATCERPRSQVVVVDITDDLATDSFTRSAKTAKSLIASGVIINGLVIEKNSFDKAIDVLGHVISPLLGHRLHTTKYYAEQTGGETATVGSPENFNAAVKRIIGNLAARYSLGFTLDESERDGGRMRRLSVKVKARDERGRERKVTVSARRGYFMSEKGK
jgi:VWFA-related protein